MASEVTGWLQDNGFTQEANPAWYRNGTVRLVIDDPEGFYTVYALHQRGWELFSTAYRSAPLSVIAAGITATQALTAASTSSDSHPAPARTRTRTRR